MAHYDYNKKNYKALTLRLHLEKDADIIQHLQKVGAVNSYIRDLISKDMDAGREKQFEVIKESGSEKMILSSFDEVSDAVEYMYSLPVPDPLTRFYVVQRFRGILRDGKKLNCGKIYIEKEEK